MMGTYEVSPQEPDPILLLSRLLDVSFEREMLLNELLCYLEGDKNVSSS